MKIKGKTHYWVDIVIAVGFVVSAISGVILYLVPNGGFRGGRLPAASGDVLFIARSTWKSIHTWSSYAMAAGVLAHLVLHWEWIKCMTRNVLRRSKSGRAKQACETSA
jgi:hypothetical protein